MKRYEAYLFDLYGTLVDIHTDESRPALWRAAAAEFAAAGAEYAACELRERYLDLCAAETARLQAAFPGAAVEIDLLRVFRALYAERGVEADQALLRQTALRFRRCSTTHLQAYAGAGELLDAVRAAGKTVILLSNAQAAFTLPELDELGLAQRFDRIFISSDAGFKKPDPRFFRMPLETLGLEPADCLMIGNDPDCDVKGALAVGMDTAFLRSALSPAGDLPKDAVLCLPRMDLRRLKRCLLHSEE